MAIGAQAEGRWAGRDSGALSFGAWLIVLVALASSAAILAAPSRKSGDVVMWASSTEHATIYRPIFERWNAQSTPELGTVDLRLMSLPSLQRRMLGSFLSQTDSSDLMEVERKVAGLAFLGPIESVGFADLTDRLKAEGLMEQINKASFSPWTSRGRIFGLPHDVHAVMLGYRADIVEAAGIDVSKIETWDDFERVMGPLIERGETGKPPRFLLNMAGNNGDHLELLILQAGGGVFDDAGRVVIDSPVNAKVLATVARWCVGPDRIAEDAPNFAASGNKLKADGYVLTSFFPDWMGAIWAKEIAPLSGKMKLMPLPAWEKGGRRTSVWGGTMLGIPRTAAKTPSDFDRRWTLAKNLYLSRDQAIGLWRMGGIVSPVRACWSDSAYDEPNAYFSGQAVGRMYINLAERIPMRSSSPYNTEALARVVKALTDLCEDAKRSAPLPQSELERLATIRLKSAAAQVNELLNRNEFLKVGAGVSP
ncbi:MAG: extracellular solute-binding protein [Planctomycetota bacterium]